MMAGDTTVRSGRPRSQAADDAILRAALDLLREHGYGGLTMASIIERAGVSSATLYRRWATKQDLVLAALELQHCKRFPGLCRVKLKYF